MFWKKKKQSDDVWGVIVNPLASDLEKAELIEKLMEILPFSMEEASQLVERTPLVLFDSLPLATASELKIYFKHLGIDVLTTNDDQIKKKCFKVVWPKQPRFDFLRKPDHTMQETIPEQSPVTDLPIEEIPQPQTQQQPLAQTPTPTQTQTPHAPASLAESVDDILKDVDPAVFSTGQSSGSGSAGGAQSSNALVDDLYAELEKLKSSNEVFGRSTEPTARESRAEEKPKSAPIKAPEPEKKPVLAKTEEKAEPKPEIQKPHAEGAVVSIAPADEALDANAQGGFGDEIEALYNQLEKKKGAKEPEEKKQPEAPAPEIEISHNTVYGEGIKEEKKVEDINAVIADLEKKEQITRSVFEPSQQIVLPEKKMLQDETPVEKKATKKKDVLKTPDVPPTPVLTPRSEAGPVAPPAPSVTHEPKIAAEVHIPVQETSDMFKQIDLLFDSMTGRESKDKKKDKTGTPSEAPVVQEPKKTDAAKPVHIVQPAPGESGVSKTLKYLTSKETAQLEADRDQYRAKVSQLEQDLVALKTTLTQTQMQREAAENDKNAIARDLEQLRASDEQKSEEIARLQESCAQVDAVRKEKEALDVRVQEMGMASEQMRMEYELKVHDLSEHVTSLTAKITELQSAIAVFDAEKIAFEQKRVEIADKIRNLLNVNRELQHFKTEAEELHVELQKNKRSFEDVLVQKDKEQVAASEQLNQLTRRFEEAVKENDLLKVEVGQLKNELRKFTSEREKTELIQRRAQVQTTIKEQETRLVRLAEDQAKIIKELEDRQSVVQQLSTMRAEIEKALSDARQSEKYILETLMKKDKPRQGRSSSEETESA